MTGDFSSRERAEIVRLQKSLIERPEPANWKPLGCLLTMASVAAVVFLPALARWLELGRVATAIALAVFGLLFLIGIGMALFGSAGYGQAMDRVEEAVTDLQVEYPDGSPERLREAAVSLLMDAYYSEGPTTTGTYDREEMALRLGLALEYVKEIERVMLEEDLIYPVFTFEEDDDEPEPA